jgi:phosphatidylglycerophosphate synthase
VRTVQIRAMTGPILGLIGQLVLLTVLAATVGLSGFGWAIGIACGLVTNAALARGLAGSEGLGPADRVTLLRATLVGGVAALTADWFSQPAPVATVVTLSAVALVLDGVDGRVARRTGTASTLGARFDLEVDAFLILVLSGYVARSTGAWVLAIGAARYAFVAGRWLLPWLRGTPPARYWCKVVAATQGIVLTVAAADVLPGPVIDALLAASLALLAESFGREVWWLWRHRQVESAPIEVADRPQGVRTVVTALFTVFAALLVWFALVAPNKLSGLAPGAFVRIPLEGLILVLLALVLRPRAGRAAAIVIGVVLSLLVIVKALDMGFFAVFDRPFDVLNDWYYLGPGVGVLTDSIGRPGAIGVVIAVALLVVALVVVLPLSVLRLSRLVAGRPRPAIRVVAVLGIVWVLCAATGVQLNSGARVASTSASTLVYDQVSQLHDDIVDRKTFAKAIATDRLHDASDSQLLSGLRGKDVVLAFVESYGRVAVQGSTFSPKVDATLDAGTNKLHAAGFSSRSAFLTSPTFGAGSWLAHSTLQSGLWVDSQQRYNQLVTHDRLTLTDAFGQAGWRTVFDVPANTTDWPEGSKFYHFDKLYDSRNVGYRGPKFSYAPMPDQYVLSAFQHQELAKTNRAPVMAEIDLVSSHHPWTPLPHLVPWNRVGDGSVFDGMPAQGESPEVAFRDPDKVRALYGQSIEYTLNSLFSFVQTYPDPNLVLIVVGDHQPHTYVSGTGAGHDVPISIIAHDPAVMDQISGWGWQAGMKPSPDAPVWRMDTFRDKFFAAYGINIKRATSASGAH